MESLLLGLTNGLVVGCIYGVVTLALVLVYKGGRVINLAQADFGMIGAFVFYSLAVSRGWPMFLAAVVALSASVALGVVTDRVVVQPLRDKGGAVVLVATLGVSGLLQVFAIDVWGANPVYFPSLAGSGVYSLGAAFITQPQLFAVAVVAAVVVGTWLLYTRTTLGLRVRAVAQNPYGSILLGQDARRISTAIWATGGFLSGLAALVIAPIVTFQVFFMFLLLGRALAAGLLGGLTNLAGAFGAAILIGVFESYFTLYVSVPGGMEIALLAFIIGTLLLRPRGLFAAEY